MMYICFSHESKTESKKENGNRNLGFYQEDQRLPLTRMLPDQHCIFYENSSFTRPQKL